MKAIRVACMVGAQPGTFRVYVGAPAPGYAPLHFQAAWLREERGGVIDTRSPLEVEGAPRVPDSVAGDEAPDQD